MNEYAIHHRDLFHSIFPFHFVSSNPSFFIDPVSSTISINQFFLSIIIEFSSIDRNSIRNYEFVSISYQLNHNDSFNCERCPPVCNSTRFLWSAFYPFFLIIIELLFFSFSLFIEFSQVMQLSNNMRIDFFRFPLTWFTIWLKLRFVRFSHDSSFQANPFWNRVKSWIGVALFILSKVIVFIFILKYTKPNLFFVIVLLFYISAFIVMKVMILTTNDNSKTKY